MKLNKDIKYCTLHQGDIQVGIDLSYKLPTKCCMDQPSILVIEHNGVYYIVKSRFEIEGDPCNTGSKPVNPYDLDYNEFTNRELRAVCNPSTNYKLPEGFIGQNVLVHMGAERNKSFEELTEAICKLYKEDKSVQEIADLLAIAPYLVESTLIARFKINFR